MLPTKFLKILEKIAFAFIKSHRTNLSFQVDQLVRQIPSTNQSLSDEHSGSLTPRLLKHSYQIYIPEARTPDILKIPNRCTFWKLDPQTSETFLSDINSGSSNPGHSETFQSDEHSGSMTPRLLKHSN